jgi:hypothetical protein
MTAPGPDFVVCPHCWHLNPPARLCARCFADMGTLLQESGGKRWTAAAQSPMPVRGGGGLSRRQRWVLLGAVVLFAISQVALALASLAPGGGVRNPAASHARTDD